MAGAQERRRGRSVRSEIRSEPPFEGAIHLANWPEGWQPTLPIESKAEALRYMIHHVNSLGLGKAIPNMKMLDVRYGINPEVKYVSHNNKEGEFTAELLILPSLRVGTFTVTNDGFVSRVWEQE